MAPVTDRPTRRRRWPWVLASIFLIFVVVGLVWVRFAGRMLVRGDTPVRADAVVILSGDPLGDRLKAGTDVFLSTGSHRLVVFLPPAGTLYDQQPAAMRYMREHGVPRGDIRVVPAQDSTAAEAGTIAAYAERCGWSTIEVATSPYHTRRAGFLFGQALGDGSSVTTVASGEQYDAAHWWRDPGDRENTLLEWTKLVSDLGALFSPPSGGDPSARC